MGPSTIDPFLADGIRPEAHTELLLPEIALARLRGAGASRRKRAGVLLASAGLALALVLMAALKVSGYADIPWRSWWTAVGATALVQLIAWWLPHRDRERLFPGDPHYIYVPTLGVMVLLAGYIYMAPGVRGLVLMMWPVVLLLLAGNVGWAGVAGLSAAMTVLYLGALAAAAGDGSAPAAVYNDAATAVAFLVTHIFAGAVFERLRRHQQERRHLRRTLAAMALTDALTGLPNRRHLEECLKKELGRIHRYDGSLSLALLDLDHFKSYNDALGHPAGDLALREVAELLRGEVREVDLLARYGGEEFALVMVNATKREARAIVDRLREVVAAHAFRDAHVQPGGRFTLSAGVASSPEDGDDYAGLILQADQALYAAKHAGRNRVVAVGQALAAPAAGPS